MKTGRSTTLDVLSGMSPDRVRRNLSAFSARYVLDWENWLRVSPSERASLFAATLRRWQATRPSPLRRCRAEAIHDRPHIEDLLDEADRYLVVLGGLTVADLDQASSDQIATLQGLWSTFLRLPQAGTATCVGITKAVLLVSGGRIGPAFDSTVRG